MPTSKTRSHKAGGAAVGGVRRGQGRRAFDGVEDVRLCQVTLDDETVQFLGWVGKGNLSYGVRAAARDIYHRVSTPAPVARRVYGGQRRRQVSLDDWTIEFLGWFGSGSLSFGIRQAAALLQNALGKESNLP